MDIEAYVEEPLAALAWGRLYSKKRPYELPDNAKDVFDALAAALSELDAETAEAFARGSVTSHSAALSEAKRLSDTLWLACTAVWLFNFVD